MLLVGPRQCLNPFPPFAHEDFLWLQYKVVISETILLSIVGGISWAAWSHMTATSYNLLSQVSHIASAQ